MSTIDSKGKLLSFRYGPESRLPVDTVLDNAREVNLEDVLIIGRTFDDKAVYLSSYADKDRLVYEIEKLKFQILSGRLD